MADEGKHFGGYAHCPWHHLFRSHAFCSPEEQSEKIALVALGFYILEAALLAVSRIEAFSLLRISQEYVIAGQPAYLETMGNRRSNPWILLDQLCIC